jgi:hypothetical protein
MAVQVSVPNRRLVVVGPPYMEGPDVEAVQLALHIDPDKRYGPNTRDAARNWKFRTGYPTGSLDGDLGVAGQRMLLGLDPIPPAFAKRAAERTSGADALDAFIAGRSWLITSPHYASVSPLVGKGGAFVDSGRRHHVDPRFLVAIATQEGRLGTYKPTATFFNTFGIGPNTPFESWEANIEAAATNLARPPGPPAHGGHYVGANTIRAIGNIWAPVHAKNDPQGLNNSWVKNVTLFYGKLGGQNSPDALVKSAP